MSLTHYVELYREHGARKVCEFIRTRSGYAIAVHDFDVNENEPVYWVLGNDTARQNLITVMQGEPGMGSCIVFSTLEEINVALAAGQPTLALVAEDEVRAIQETEMSQ